MSVKNKVKSDFKLIPVNPPKLIKTIDINSNDNLSQSVTLHVIRFENKFIYCVNDEHNNALYNVNNESSFIYKKRYFYKKEQYKTWKFVSLIDEVNKVQIDKLADNYMGVVTNDCFFSEIPSEILIQTFSFDENYYKNKLYVEIIRKFNKLVYYLNNNYNSFYKNIIPVRFFPIKLYKYIKLSDNITEYDPFNFIKFDIINYIEDNINAVFSIPNLTDEEKQNAIIKYVKFNFIDNELLII